jgi:protease-4
MILNDLNYQMQAGRPMLIDPLKFKAFMDNANMLLSNPDIAYHISAWSDKYDNTNELKNRKRRKRAGLWDEVADDEDNNMAAMFSPPTLPYVHNGMGIIPVVGVIGKNMSKMETMLGCCDIKTIAEALDFWKDRKDVQEVVFKYDSGGGSTAGLEELARKIRTYPKRTISYCEDDCGSAAFWLASQSAFFIGTPSASIGSVGIYLVVKDESAKHEAEGVKFVIIKSGDYKAAGVENTALNKLQAQRLQDEVVELHSRFKRDVKMVRLFVEDADMEGQSYYGNEALVRGFITNLVYEWSEAEQLILGWRQGGINVPGNILNRLYPTD